MHNLPHVKRFDSFKPAASARTHLLLAAVMWSAVGGALLFFGTRWLLAERSALTWTLLLVALLGGLLKARFILRKSARRIVQRIRARGDGRCLGGFISWKSWLLVLCMMTLGRLLRAGYLPRTCVGFLYALIGAALLTAAVSLWRAWVEPPGPNLNHSV